MHEIGIQWQRETDAVLEYNRLVQPTVLKGINCRTREFWQQLASDNPNSTRIYRHYPNYDEWRDEPERCARGAVHAIMAEIAHIRDLITHIEDNNEWVFPFFSDVEIDAADCYMETFIKIAWNSFGMRVVFLNSACGNWGDDIVKFWRTLQAAEDYSAVLGQHEYDYPTMMRIYEESGDYWLCGKWKKSMDAIKAESYEGIKVIITEAGIDGGVADKPMKGWRSVPNSLENYCASLLWYNDLLIADDDVLGAAIFIMSGEGMWNDFDIENSEVPNRIARFPTVPPPEPPEEPNGDGMKVKVIDQEYKEQTEEWARTKYGIDWERVEVVEGEPVWRLVELWEHPGAASHITQTLDKDGNALEGIVVAWRFSSLPDADIAGPNDWYRNFVYGPTNANGDVGPAMSTDSYIGEGECGPHQVWVHDDEIKSDLLKCIGMLAGTFHAKLDAKFKLVTGKEPLPDPKNMEVIDDWSEMANVAMLYLVYPKKIAWDTRGRAGIVGSDIDLETSEPEAYEWQGKTWACVGVCTHFTEDEQRIFWLEAHDYHTGAAVTPRVSNEFGPNEKRAKYFIVNFKGEEPPEPPPEPVWTMTVTRWPGIRLLIGQGIPISTSVTISAPWGNPVTVTAGSKAEHGPGGWEVNIWHAANYTIGFLEEVFNVDVGDETVKCTFTLEEPEPPPEPIARLVSCDMPREDAEEILAELEEEGYIQIFEIEER